MHFIVWKSKFYWKTNDNYNANLSKISTNIVYKMENSNN